MFSLVDTAKFFEALIAVGKINPTMWESVGLESFDFYEASWCYLTEDEDCGFIIRITTEGLELSSLFNVSHIKGLGEQAVIYAMYLGADHLNCFEGFLPKYYEKLGWSTYKIEDNTNGHLEPKVHYMRI